MAEVGAMDIERWLQDHDTDVVSEVPPVQNTWYECFHAEDVRLIKCAVIQTNDEVAAKGVEVRWTIDGNVYFVAANMDDSTIFFIYRNRSPSTGGTLGLTAIGQIFNAGYYVDKRGLDFKVEVRLIHAPGTNQTLTMQCVRETQEIT